MKFFPDSRWLRDNWPAFPIALLAILYFWNVLSGRYLLTERDLTLFFIPPRLFWLDEIKNHTFPLWNPYFNGGHPLFATLQTGVLYPFSLLFLFLPFAVAFNWTIVLHFAIAGVSMFALLRAQKAGSGASYVAAICFIFGGYMLSVQDRKSVV